MLCQLVCTFFNSRYKWNLSWMFWQGNCPFDIFEQGDRIFHHSVWCVRLAKWSDRLNVPNFRKMSCWWSITQEYLILSFFFPIINSFKLSCILVISNFACSLVHAQLWPSWMQIAIQSLNIHITFIPSSIYRSGMREDPNNLAKFMSFLLLITFSMLISRLF
jgi:hypothetical protein